MKPRDRLQAELRKYDRALDTVIMLDDPVLACHIRIEYKTK